MASENVKEFTISNFQEEVLQSKEPVLVDFWADWCDPCIRLGPTIEKLAADYKGKIKVGKVNTEANFDLARNYQISGLPTVILFKDGKEVERKMGLRKESEFKEMLNTW